MIPATALGAIVASIIAAGISLLTLIITKENKISDFRQEWINELRNDISKAISSVATINLLFGTDQQSQHKKEYIEAWSKTSEALALVELRLNIRESDHQILQSMIREAEALIRAGESGTFDQEKAEDLQDRVVRQTQVILKREWDRVRQGEPVFRLAKNVAAAAFTFISLAAIFVLLLNYNCSSCELGDQESRKTTCHQTAATCP